MSFQEIQYPGWIVFVILAGVGFVVPIVLVCLARITSKKEPRYVPVVLLTAAVVAFLLVVGIFLGTGKMTTEVDDSKVRVTFGWVRMYQRTVLAADIAAVESVEYNPNDYGGSGIRGQWDNLLLSQQGTKGAKLTLKEGGTLIIGSGRADELAEAIEKISR